MFVGFLVLEKYLAVILSSMAFVNRGLRDLETVKEVAEAQPMPINN